MARAPTTTDVFSAIAEPRRRQILDILAKRGSLAVGAMVVALGLPQPAVSKHLGVLLKVGVISVTQQGQHRVYELHAAGLKPVLEWVSRFEQHWDHQLNRIKQRAERAAAAQPPRSSASNSSKKRGSS